MIKAYFKLTKPGIIFGNALAAAAGFFLASTFEIDLELFFQMLLGIILIIASACVFNNLQDIEIDSQMERTKKRSLVVGNIPVNNAIRFGVILFLLGFVPLYFFTGFYALFFALLGFFVYVAIYTPLKRVTRFATELGAIAGATPPVVGYLAVTNNIDTAAILLFVILVLWQMPHFYAIAVYRLKDYTNASIPGLAVVKGTKAANFESLIYIGGFIIASSLLTFFKYTGYIYLVVMLLLGIRWFYLAYSAYKAEESEILGRKSFKFSLLVLLSFCVLVSFGLKLP